MLVVDELLFLALGVVTIRGFEVGDSTRRVEDVVTGVIVSSSESLLLAIVSMLSSHWICEALERRFRFP